MKRELGLERQNRLALGQKCQRLVGMDELKVVNSTIDSIGCEVVVGDGLEHGLNKG